MTKSVYSATRFENFSKDFELKNQIIRASTSSMHNIAEGFDGGSNLEFVRFLRYAQRSCTEVKSQLYVAIDQNYITTEHFQSLYAEAYLTHKKIGGFIKYLISAKE